jgi:hypothetical protein
MKKLFLIFFVFFFSFEAQAIVFENCYISKIKNKPKDSSFKKDAFEKFEYRVFSEGKIRQTIIPTDDFLKKITKDHEEFRKKEKENYGHDIGATKHEKINTKIFNITYYDEKFIKAKRSIMSSMDEESERKINLNLLDGSIQSNYKYKYQGRLILNETTLYKCKVSKSSSKSNLLDYWWAVILIIAISFFIFTQSGKRLKKIRRK